MTSSKHFVCTRAHYIVLFDPDIYDATIGATVSQVTRSRRESEHNEAQQAFQANKAVDSIIKNHLKQKKPPYIIIDTENEITGLNNMDIIDTLDHVQQ